MPSVRGSALLTRIAYVKERYGDEGWARLMPALKPTTRQVLAGKIENRSWHPFDAFVDLNVRVDALFGRGDLKLCFDMGVYGADKNLATLYRIFFQLGSVSFIMGKAASLWNEHYDSGRLVSEAPVKNHLRLVIHDFPAPSCAHCFSVMGWAARSIELTGASLAEQQRTACRQWRDPTCCLQFRLK